MKRIKTILVRILLFLLVSLLLLVLLVFVFKDSLLLKAQKALSDQLNTEIEMENLDVSPFSHLPYIGVHADKIEMQGAGKTDLLTANRLEIFINPLELLNEKMEISRFLISEGILKIIKTASGKYNYQFNEYNETASSTDLDLPSIELKNITLVYEDQMTNSKASGFLTNYTGSLKVSNVEIYLDGEGRFRLDSILLEKQLYNYPEEIDFELQVENSNEELVIEKVIIEDSYNKVKIWGQVAAVIELQSEISIDKKDHFYSFLDSVYLQLLPSEVRIKGKHKGSLSNPSSELGIKGKGINLTANHNSSSLRLDGKYALVNPYFYSPELSINKGTFQFSNFIYDYSVDDPVQALTGSVSGKNIVVSKDSLTTAIEIKEIFTSKEGIQLKGLEIKTGVTDLSFDGNLILSADDSKINGSIYSEYCRPDDLMVWYNSNEKNGGGSKKLDIQVSTEIKKLEVDTWHAEEVNSNLKLINEQLTYDAELQTCDGQFIVNGNGKIETEIVIKSKIEFTGIDVNKLLTQFNSFEQEVVTDKNLFGKIEGAAVMDFTIDKKGNIDPVKSSAKIALHATEGKLVDLQLLQDFSTYVDAEELANVKFESMTNYFEWKDNRLQLPILYIKNNAANFLISGYHDYNNRFAYNLQINAGEVLAKKLGKKNKAKREGWWNMYYYVHGYPNDFKVEANKDLVQRNLESSLLDKENLFLEMIKTFGYNDILDQLEEWQDIPEYYDN